jgi:hypothetical protein
MSLEPFLIEFHKIFISLKGGLLILNPILHELISKVPINSGELNILTDVSL